MQTYKKRFTKILIGLAGLVAAAALTGQLAAFNQKSNISTTQTASAAVETQPPTMPTYLVVACNDGDTCRLKAADNTQIKIRLVGIDAPEMGKKSRKKSKEGQVGGSEAKDFLNKLAVGKTVTLRSYGADAYGRNLAEIIVDNQPINLKMVSEGWAEVYRGKPPSGFDLTPYKLAQDEAVKAKKGIWGYQNYESPKEFRKRNKD